MASTKTLLSKTVLSRQLWWNMAPNRHASSTSHTTSQGLQRLAKRIPPGTWDCHMHVVDPHTYPVSKDAKYTSAAHTIDDARQFYNQLGIKKLNFVQTSIYGNDNACTLGGLKELGPNNGRAVVQFDPDTTSSDQLKEWHALGVRGVRLNFKSVGAAVEAEALSESLHKYANAVKDLGWVLGLYLPLEDVPKLEPVVSQLGRVKVCIDHFGHPSDASLSQANSALDLPGFPSLINLLKGGQTWVKISGSYRFQTDPRSPLTESLCRELVRARPDRCIFATDWPHTRFEHIDVADYLEPIFDWVEDEGVPLKQILVDNAQVLWDATE